MVAVCSVEIFRPAEGNDAAPEENKPTFCPFFIYISVVSSAAQTFFAHSQVRKTFFFIKRALHFALSYFFWERMKLLFRAVVACVRGIPQER